MIELYVTVCLITNPVTCKKVSLNFMADTVTPQQCMMYGQSEIAKWMKGHPNWRISKWSCGRVNTKLGKA